MKHNRTDWSFRLAVVILGVLVVGALSAWLVAEYAIGFSYQTVNPADALVSPGVLSVPTENRTFDHNGEYFAVLDTDDSGAIECQTIGNELECPELVDANRVAAQLRRRWLDGVTARAGQDQGMRVEPWSRLAAEPDFQAFREILQPERFDLDGDRHISRNELVRASAFLHFSSADAVQFDRNKDAVLSVREYPGTPVPIRHLLGTDSLGRDLLVRLLYGLRVSILVALAATLVSFLFGAILGLASGFIGGWTDRVFLRLLEVLQAIPFVFLVILVTIFSRDVLQVRWQDPEEQALAQGVVLFAALGAVQWFSLARYARGLAFSLKNAEFMRSLQGMGFATRQLVLRHLLPNTLTPLAAYATLLVPVLILEEAFLSFLGFGVQPPYPSLGILLAEGVKNMDVSVTPLVIPALAVLLLTWSLNIIADRLSSRYLADRYGRAG